MYRMIAGHIKIDVDKYGKRRSMQQSICDECKEKFWHPLRRVRRYCSLPCSRLGSRNRIDLHCGSCNNPITRNPFRLKNAKSGLLFCSRQCKDRAQRLDGRPELHPLHYGTARGDRSDVYRPIAFENHGKLCNRCGYDRHEEVLRVHHRDRNKRNRKPENLEVLCPTCHDEEHFLARDGRFNKLGEGYALPK